MADKILFLECYSGISGDMTVGALLDLGADKEKLLETLKGLPVDGYSVKIEEKRVHGLRGCDFDVILDEKQREHHHSHGHHHGHRSYGDICRILEESSLDEPVKETVGKIFALVAKAEARAHGVPEEEVTFHEVGAVDSIVDIVSAAFCFHDLQVKQVVVSDLWEGQGTIMCQHGRIPVPVPAVVEIVKETGMSLHITEVKGEMVTPTGAAIAGALRTRERLPEAFQIEKVGIGTGKRTYPHANVLRAMLLHEA